MSYVLARKFTHYMCIKTRGKLEHLAQKIFDNLKEIGWVVAGLAFGYLQPQKNLHQRQRHTKHLVDPPFCVQDTL